MRAKAADRHINPPYSLRLDPALRKRLEVAAKRNRRSLCKEIESRLESSLNESD